MTKEEIEEKLFNEDLNLEELLVLKDKMKEYDFSIDDLEYIDELIIEELDLIDDINIIKKLKSKYNSPLFDRVINRRELLTTKEIEKMNKEEIEYIYDNELHNLNIVQFFRLLTAMQKYKYSKEDINYILELIKEEIDSIEYKDYYDLLNKLNDIKMHCFKYRCNVDILNRYIKYVKTKTKTGISLGKILFWTAIGAIGNENSTSNNDLMPWEKESIKNDGYEPYNFEEEELEEDDFYYEDDK